MILTLKLLKTGTVFACLTLTLADCASYGARKLSGPDLPPLPADLLVCFDNSVPAPILKAMTKQDVIRLIAALKKSEAEKQACGRRFIAFYDRFQRQKMKKENAI